MVTGFRSYRSALFIAALLLAFEPVSTTTVRAESPKPLHPIFENMLRPRLGTNGVTTRRAMKDGRLDTCAISFSHLVEMEGRFFTVTAAFQLFLVGERTGLALIAGMQEFQDNRSAPSGMFPDGGSMAGMKLARTSLDRILVFAKDRSMHGVVVSKTAEKVSIAIRPDSYLKPILQAMDAGQLALAALPSGGQGELRLNIDFSVEDISATGERRHSPIPLDQFKQCTGDLMKQNTSGAQ